MSIVKMNSVMIFGHLEHLDQVIATCFRQNCFHPEDVLRLTENDKSFTRLADSNPYQEALSKIEELAHTLSHDLQQSEQPAPIGSVEAESVVRRISRELERFEQQRAELNRRIEFCEDALGLLQHMGSFDVDIENIFSAKLLHMRFGRLPTDSYHKLGFYSDKLLLFLVLDQDVDYSWGICFVVDGYQDEADAILSSLSFERFWVSGEIHGTPEAAREQLDQELTRLKQRLEEQQSGFEKNATTYGQRLDAVHTRMSTLFETFELRRYMAVSKEIFLAAGFIPADKAPAFAGAFATFDDVTVEIGGPEDLKDLSPPTLLQNHAFLKPMEFFVKLYGLPGYRDADPTVFMGLTYLLLYGMMFGDVGQGVVIALVGWLLDRRGLALGAVMTRLGLSSSLFGLLYGSVFGYENALDFFYHLLGFHEKPVEVLDPETITTILLFAVALGAGLLFIAMLINIGVGLAQRDLRRAVFHQNGLPGLVFYGAVLAALASVFLDGPNLIGSPVYVALFLIAPLLIIFFKEPLAKRLARRHGTAIEHHEGFSPVEGFFELFEVLLSFTTNTISFLRVGGFVLSHAGMMTVVMLLAEMAGKPADILVVILGNIFVIALEGMVCGIQVLRLQFYELFSHYFSGGGRPYRPVG